MHRLTAENGQDTADAAYLVFRHGHVITVEHGEIGQPTYLDTALAAFLVSLDFSNLSSASGSRI